MGNSRGSNPLGCTNELAQLRVEVEVRYLEGTRDAFITLTLPKMRGVWADVLEVLELNYGMDILNATLSSSPHAQFHCIHTQREEGSEISSDELQRALEQFIILS